MIRIALAGNPNSGKTTLFNALTGSNQFVGNWPGVTVEKKEGKLKKHDDVIVTDLPGIYSLSPYTPEEIVARKYLTEERPDAVLDIVDGTNIERNLYLTTQILELGIPVVIAINMMDVVRKNGDKIDKEELSKRLGCKIIEISALKGDGIFEAAEAAIEAAKGEAQKPQHLFSGSVEHALAHIEEAVIHDMPEERQRWYAIKIFERDEKVLAELDIDKSILDHIENDISEVEQEMDDDADSIIINERYNHIAALLDGCLVKRSSGILSVSNKIDTVVTSRWLGLPIFALVMALIYWTAMVGIGAPATKWATNGLFGDGFHLFGIGTGDYGEALAEYNSAADAVKAFTDVDVSAEESDAKELLSYLQKYNTDKVTVKYKPEDSDTLMIYYFGEIPEGMDPNKVNTLSYKDAVEYFGRNGFTAPSPAEYGVWVHGIPRLLDRILLDKNGTPVVKAWLYGLIQDGIVAGVGAVLGFVPQMLVLFFMLAFLEACGYMSRIAFVLDRLFRRFGLSGKSFIPILIGTGCGVPGIMASRTIQSESDRRMTVITTTFIPCGAKVPFIAMIAGAVFGGSPLVSVSAYFIGLAAIIISGIILKKTRMFAGEPTPFVMELPTYHLPMLKNVLHSAWERGWSFIKKAGTIILLSTIVIWFVSRFGFSGGSFGMLAEEDIGKSLLGRAGNVVAWIFSPLGWGQWKAVVASVTGLAAKENIVSTMGVLYSNAKGSVYQAIAADFNGVAGYSFLIFNLLCAPCFAAIGAIRREMNSAKWTLFAIGYQTVFAYVVSLIVYQLGSIFTGNVNVIGVVFATAFLAGIIYMLARPGKLRISR